MVSQLWADVKYHVPTGLCFLFRCPQYLSTEPLKVFAFQFGFLQANHGFAGGVE